MKVLSRFVCPTRPLRSLLFLPQSRKDGLKIRRVLINEKAACRTTLGSQLIPLRRAWPTSNQVACFGPVEKEAFDRIPPRSPRMINRAFSPQIPFGPETQADGLGWYGGAPSVLSFAATRATTLMGPR